MNTRIIRLIDQDQTVLATVQATDEGDHYGGTIDLHPAPANLRSLFEEFEEIVNGQMFAFLDDLQEKIAAWRIKAHFEDGSEFYVKDLQVFPSTGDVSFRLVGVPAPTAPLS